MILIFNDGTKSLISKYIKKFKQHQKKIAFMWKKLKNKWIVLTLIAYMVTNK